MVEELEEVLVEETTTSGYSLLLWNDPVNTFDAIIEALMEILNHEPQQAEQCALIAHYKGKCGVKNGEFEDLVRFHEAFSIRKITTSVERVVV